MKVWGLRRLSVSVCQEEVCVFKSIVINSDLKKEKKSWLQCSNNLNTYVITLLL